MSKLHWFDLVALILVIVGGLNWGLWGLFEFDLVATIFGELSILSRIIYILVAAGAVYTAFRSPSFAHLGLGHGGRTPHPAS